MKSKREIVDEMLAAGMTTVMIDARRQDVIVPQQFENACDLRLNLSWKFRGSNMELGDNGIWATLTFGGQPFNCFLPWDAIWNAYCEATHHGTVWPESAPPEFNASAFVEKMAETIRSQQPEAKVESKDVVPLSAHRITDNGQTPTQRRAGFRVIRGGKTS